MALKQAKTESGAISQHKQMAQGQKLEGEPTFGCKPLPGAKGGSDKGSSGGEGSKY